MEMDMVTETTKGVWSVHQRGKHPVDGVPVYFYEKPGTWRCSEDAEQDCDHVKLVKAQMPNFEACPECGGYRPEDERVMAGMRCRVCVYAERTAAV